MIPAITDIRRSLSSAPACFNRLTGIRPADGMPAERNTMFAEFAVEWHGEPWLLCTPLTDDAAERVARIAPKLNACGSKYLAECRVFHSELRFTDSAGREHLCDVVMQRLPGDFSLERIAALPSHERMLAELEAMQAEFRRMGLVHNNLKPCNIIIADDGRPVAIRYGFAEFGGTTAGDDAAFEALRQCVLAKPAEESADDELSTVCGCRVEAGTEVIGTEHEQRIRILRGGLIGYADPTGRSVIEPRFDSAEEFREGRAEVEVKGRFGLIDKSGRFVVPALYEYIEYHDDCGISLVRSQGEWSAFDYEGHPLGIHHREVGRVCEMLKERLKITIEI